MERLFSSRALYRTLALFFRYPEEPLNLRLISLHTGVDIKSVLRELGKLQEMGILRVQEMGRYRMHKLNRMHPAVPGFRSIFGRARKEGGMSGEGGPPRWTGDGPRAGSFPSAYASSSSVRKRRLNSSSL